MGLIFVAAGIVPILGALGVLPLPLTPGTPVWVGVCAGLLFVLAGGAIINGYAIAGGAAPDGDLPPGTPFRVQLAQFVLGLGIYGLFAAIFGWVAFGKGARHGPAPAANGWGAPSLASARLPSARLAWRLRFEVS
jgi:hypothetical protein